MKKTLCCLQPTYIPWIPFFERIYLSDIFVILDDVDFSKNSNHNRNLIRSNSNKLMLTVPIHQKSRQLIKDVKIDNSKNWKKKHWFSIKQNYQKSSFFNEIENELETIYSKNWIYLSELNIEIIKLILGYLKINKEIFISSEIKVEGTANEKLINLCKYFKATRFIVKPETDNYHPKILFEKNNIDFKFYSNKIRVYNQESRFFLPGLSIIDYMANNGNSLTIFEN